MLRRVESQARSALGVAPLLAFRGFAVAPCEPDEMGIAVNSTVSPLAITSTFSH